MSGIHPSAVIENGAQIADGCVIGPFCHVGANVCIGEKTVLHSHVVLDGHMKIGRENEIYSFACLGKKTQDLKYKGEVSYVEIGDRNVIREYVTINAATAAGEATKLGSDCLIQSYCHIAHDCILGDHVIMSSGAMIAGHVIAEDYAIISGYCGVVQFVRIGKHSFLSGYSKLAQDLLPYSIGDGAPAEIRTVNKVGMQRRDFSDKSIRNVHKAIKRIISFGLTIEEASEELLEEFPDCPEVLEIFEFCKHTKQGLARPRKR